VSGTGKKPFKQKGTGQARQGCSRAPQYPGGGVAFGPQAKTYNLSMNKKARKAALRSALSYLYQSNNITVLNDLSLDAVSTKGFVKVLDDLSVNKTIIITEDLNRNLELSARNVKDVKILKSESLNIHDMLKYKQIIFTQDAVRKVEGALKP
jgi:large subunit ribosomal protein L4